MYSVFSKAALEVCVLTALLNEHKNKCPFVFLLNRSHESTIGIIDWLTWIVAECVCVHMGYVYVTWDSKIGIISENKHFYFLKSTPRIK